jgi:hypothetical protein
MDVFVFQAALLCEDCGARTREEMIDEGDAPDDPDDEGTYDSDDFPKGPYGDGGGEADTPQHCDICGLFLENPLTGDGRTYVEETVERDSTAGRKESVAMLEWAPYYGVKLEARERKKKKRKE